MDYNIRLGLRESQVVELLLQGCDNGEIAKELKITPRTVKAHFNRLFFRFGIKDGIKRVKLVVLMYRRQTWIATEAESSSRKNRELLNSSLQDLRTQKSREFSAPPSMLSKTTSRSFSTKLECGTGLS